jgi:hypothetical protein
MSDSEAPNEAPKIKVTDRRLFDADGNFRAEVAEPANEAGADSSAEAPTEPAATDAPQPAAATPVQETPSEATTMPPRPAPAAPREAAPTPSAELPKLAEESLLRFIEEQYIGGLLALGAMPEPQSGEMMEDLDLAQVRIEVLGLLQSHLDATLPPEARKGFEDVLYQLRMLYLQKSKVAKL